MTQEHCKLKIVDGIIRVSTLSLITIIIPFMVVSIHCIHRNDNVNYS